MRHGITQTSEEEIGFLASFDPKYQYTPNGQPDNLVSTTLHELTEKVTGDFWKTVGTIESKIDIVLAQQSRFRFGSSDYQKGMELVTRQNVL